MSVAIGFDTARWYWRLAASGYLPDPISSRITSTRPCHARIEQLSGRDQRALEELGAPLTLIVPTPSKRRVRSGITCRVIQGRVPPGSFCTVGDDLLVPSPEFCFLQLARDSSVQELVLAGLELCGRYSIMPGSEGGFIAHEPVTTIKRLGTYIDNATGMPGVQRARQALQWIADGSESPRETISVMLLCLPLRLGGYGFELPMLNAIVHIGEQASALSHREWHRCDLLWPGARIAVEYDSDAWHTGADHIAQDAAKRGALFLSNVTVFTLTNRQVNDITSFDAFAHLLAKGLGKQLKRPSKKTYYARLDLRELLLSRVYE